MSTSVEISLDTAKLPVVATGVSELMGAIDMDASASSVLGEPKLAGCNVWDGHMGSVIPMTTTAVPFCYTHHHSKGSQT